MLLQTLHYFSFSEINFEIKTINNNFLATYSKVKTLMIMIHSKVGDSLSLKRAV